jgi:hypothetical protein
MVYKSKTITKDLNPCWDETFHLTLEDLSTQLDLKVSFLHKVSAYFSSFCVDQRVDSVLRFFFQRRYDSNGNFQMKEGKNWILPKEVNSNRIFWDSHWLEIWSNHFCPSMGPNGGSVAMDPIVLIGTPLHPPSRVCPPPLWFRGGGTHSLAGYGVPIRTRGQTLW